MILSISNYFKKESPFERGLKKSSILNNEETINIHDLKEMFKGFNDGTHEKPMNCGQILISFFMLIPKNPNPKIKLKILITIHILIGDYNKGQELAKKFLSWQGWIDDTKSNRGEVHQLIKSYLTFLQKIANNYKIIQMCKMKSYQNIKNLGDQINVYYKLINILNFVFHSIQDLLKQVLNEKSNELVYQEIYLLIWNDLIAIYLYIEQIIFEFLYDSQKVNVVDFQNLFDIIPDFQSCTQKIQDFFQLSDYFDKDNSLTQLKWKHIDKKQLEELKHQIQSQKIHSHRQQPLRFQKTPNNYEVSVRSQTYHSPGYQSKYIKTTYDFAKQLSTSQNPQKIFEYSEVDDIQLDRNRFSTQSNNKQIKINIK